MKTLRDLRKAANITQAEMAFFVSSQAEGGQPVISKIENNVVTASRATLSIYVLLSLLTPEERSVARKMVEQVCQQQLTE